MDRNKIRKLQLAELEILRETDKICKTLNINYYLIGGTLIGAIRHGGFIPWDVDIDIAMLRKDYEIFGQYVKNNKCGNLFYQDYITEKNHTECHAVLKLLGTEIKYNTHNDDKYGVACDGIYMDIFPLDYAPDEKRLQSKQKNQIKLYSGLIQAKICRDYGSGKMVYITKKILSIFLRPISFMYLQKKVDTIMTKYNDTNKTFLVSMASHYSYTKQLMPQEIYGEPKKILFEGIEFYAPAKIEAYLERIYGDYMKLPPESTRYKIPDMIEYVDFGKYDFE